MAQVADGEPGALALAGADAVYGQKCKSTREKTLRLFCGDCHLAAGAVETEGETAAVVKKEQRAGVFGALVNRAEAEFIADAVAGAH